jgi:hypothetical protein
MACINSIISYLEDDMFSDDSTRSMALNDLRDIKQKLLGICLALKLPLVANDLIGEEEKARFEDFKNG